MAALALGVGVMVAQTVPRVAGPFEFTLMSGATARLADYKGRVVALYLFTPK